MQNIKVINKNTLKINKKLKINNKSKNLYKILIIKYNKI